MRQWYALDRLEDPTGISGLGVIAWVLELSDSSMLMFWDTTVAGKPTHTVEWLPNPQRLLDIHGHDVLRHVSGGAAMRGIELAAHVFDDLESAVWELNAELLQAASDDDDDHDAAEAADPGADQ